MIKDSTPRWAKAFVATLAVCTVLALSACGGGGGGGSPAAASSAGSGGSGGSGGGGGGGTFGPAFTGAASVTCFSGTGSVVVGGATPQPNLTTPWPPAPCSPPVGCAGPLTGTHHTYNVGAGQTYANLTNVPWLSLVAGDVVNIYPGVYSTIVALRAQGTATAPVIINGVTDTSCRRPIISGKNANTAADAIAQGFFTGSGGSLIDGSGIFVLWWNDTLSPDNFGYKPSFIAIQNLQIQDANPNYSYTDINGKSTQWSSFTAGIYAVVASVLTIQNCTIINNGLGVFVNSKNDDQDTSYYVTLRGNSIYNNGIAASYTEHNVYVQGVRSLYEGNYIGGLIPNAQGGSLKDRSSGPVVRYNYIVSAARAIDLVDNENGSPTIQSDPLYNYGWIYGNLILNGPNGSSDLIHWGGDSATQGNPSSYAGYHDGPLYVYFNTIVNTGSGPAMFDMATALESFSVHSNIIAATGGVALCTDSAAEISPPVGTVNLLDTNWIQPGYTDGTCTVTAGTLLGGAPVLTATYGLPAGSPAIGAGVPFPVTAPPSPASVANLTPTFQISSTQDGYPSYVARGSVSDLGAFAGP
ncbi:MAG: right-handed parallel beta-helix repeat-containing protein [Burkholderiaceae bacterium]